MSIRQMTLAVACTFGLLLSGCSTSESESTTNVSPPSSTQGTTSAGKDPLGHLTSCDQVAGLVEPYIDALVLTDNSTVDEWGITCKWEAADDETDLANNRSVAVQAVVNEPGTEPPVLTGVLKMDGSEQLDDPWLDAREALAYSVTMGTAVAAVAVTTIWLPDVEINVSGGRWAGFPSLDGRAALGVAQAMLVN